MVNNEAARNGARETEMKRSLIAVLSVVAMVVVLGGTAQAAVTLSGTLGGVDSNSVKDDGDGNHDYDIDRSLANTFYWSAGSTVTITGTVDVRALASGSYLQIGLVDKEQADLSLDTYGWGGYMFNNSAFATFYAGTRNYARLADNNALYSGQLFNAPGATVGVFDFALDILSDGTMDLTLHGSSDVSTTYTYGHRNWWDGWSGWSGGELENGSYLIAQLWIDTGNTGSLVRANYDITGASVPEPGTMIIWSLLGLTATGFGRWRRKRAV
jgi:hypothetical protein